MKPMRPPISCSSAATALSPSAGAPSACAAATVMNSDNQVPIFMATFPFAGKSAPSLARGCAQEMAQSCIFFGFIAAVAASPPGRRSSPRAPPRAATARRPRARCASRRPASPPGGPPRPARSAAGRARRRRRRAASRQPPSLFWLTIRRVGAGAVDVEGQGVGRPGELANCPRSLQTGLAAVVWVAGRRGEAVRVEGVVALDRPLVRQERRVHAVVAPGETRVCVKAAATGNSGTGLSKTCRRVAGPTSQQSSTPAATSATGTQRARPRSRPSNT